MPSADLTLDPHFTVGAVNRRLFGSFVEHLGRCVYDGIYEPGHPTADPEGFRTDVHGAGPRARRLHHPLPRRQLRLRLPLGGLRRPARGAPGAARPGLALDREQRGRARRVRRLAGEGRQRADVRGQPRHPRRAGGASTCSSTRTSARAPRCRTPAIKNGRVDPHRHQDVVPRQRDGRAVAARPPQRRGLRQDRVADGEGDAPARPRPRARRVRQLERADADLRRRGSTPCCATPTTTSTTSPATPTTRSATATPAASSPSRDEHGPLHRVRGRDRGHRPRRARADEADQHLLRRVERLVQHPLPHRASRSPTSSAGRPRPRLLEDALLGASTRSSSATC